MYTKFIFRNVLKRFNRFFMIKKEDLPSGEFVHSIYEHYGKKTFRQLLRENYVAHAKDKKIPLSGQYYPYYSYNDDIYLHFMTQIFKSL